VLSPQGRVRWRSLYSCVRRLRGEAPDALCARRRGRSRRSADSTAAPSNRQRRRGPPVRAASSSCPSTSEFALARMAPRAPSGSHRGDTTHDPSGGSLRQPVPQRRKESGCEMSTATILISPVPRAPLATTATPSASSNATMRGRSEPLASTSTTRCRSLTREERRQRSFRGRSGRPPTLVRGMTIPKQQEAVQ
jgi:hypothetical protein